MLYLHQRRIPGPCRRAAWLLRGQSSRRGAGSSWRWRATTPRATTPRPSPPPSPPASLLVGPLTANTTPFIEKTADIRSNSIKHCHRPSFKSSACQLFYSNPGAACSSYSQGIASKSNSSLNPNKRFNRGPVYNTTNIFLKNNKSNIFLFLGEKKEDFQGDIRRLTKHGFGKKRRNKESLTSARFFLGTISTIIKQITTLQTWFLKTNSNVSFISSYHSFF